MYTPVAQQVFHVDVPTATISGNNNVGCGHVNWPCETIDYALQQCAFRHPIVSGNVRKIGIISGYIVNQTYSLTTTFEDRVEIQNSLNYADDNASTTVLSDLIFMDDGYFNVNLGTVAFRFLNFKVSGRNSIYVIKGDTLASGIEISECQMSMTGSEFNISIGLVDLQHGTLIIDKLTVRDITLAGGPIIKSISTAGSISISNSSFENIKRLDPGNILGQIDLDGSDDEYIISNCIFSNIETSYGNGGCMELYIQNRGQASVNNCSFTSCSAEDNGGAIFASISSGGKLILDYYCEFFNCTAFGNGGAIYVTIDGTLSKVNISGRVIISSCTAGNDGGALYFDSLGGQVLISNVYVYNCSAILTGGGFRGQMQNAAQITLDDECEFYQCTSEDGGALFVYSNSPSTKFASNSVIIHDCIANYNSITTFTTGLGGGICLMCDGDYAVSPELFNLTGLRIYNNSAAIAGQSVFIVSNKFVEWCQLGTAGQYVKGNYSDAYSNYSELEGLNGIYNDMLSLPSASVQYYQKYLQQYWDTPRGQIFHILNRSPYGTNDTGCGLFDNPCRTFEYAIQQQPYIYKDGVKTFIDEKKIGICSPGYDLNAPVSLSKTASNTSTIWIVKELFRMQSEMTGQAEIKILKNNDNSKENGKQGWISAAEGLQLRMHGLNIIMDSSQLTIPIIYIEGANSLLELNTVTFSGIKLSPTTKATGIVQINYDNSQLIAQSCIFKNILIQSKGGNAIRILNNGQQPIITTINACEFNNISSIGDSSGLGGSAIFMESKHGSKLIIEDSCQFTKCIVDKGNGGAIYIDIDFTSEFLFKIHEATIQECSVVADTTKEIPPTGYGGGIFLTGTGDNNASLEKLDLHGMKIYNNTATKGGQSLYAAMSKLASWCRFGSLGEFVKGNYSDDTSSEPDLQGIIANRETFISYTSDLILSDTYNLEDYWRVLTANADLYVRSDGNDDLFCTSTFPCKRLDAYHLNNNINIPYIYQVYIMDSSTINYKAEITQTFSERIYGPLANESTTVRNLLIETEGQFDVKGKILFNYINFVVQATSLSNGQHTIQGLLSTSQISLQNCQYHMASSEISIGKSLVCMLKGGTQTITNLTVSDITSVENIIKAEFDESGTLTISNSQFERVTKTSNSVIGGTTKVILSYASNQVSISNSQFK
ncbi:MAG: hypothetical protein EZS28_027851, partial [Streblomastix strix]